MRILEQAQNDEFLGLWAEEGLSGGTDFGVIRNYDTSSELLERLNELRGADLVLGQNNGGAEGEGCGSPRNNMSTPIHDLTPPPFINLNSSPSRNPIINSGTTRQIPVSTP